MDTVALDLAMNHENSRKKDIPVPLLDGTYDSQWWESNRGRPSWIVIIGIWLTDGLFAVTLGLFSAVVIFGLLSLAADWLGLVRFNMDLTGGTIFILFICMSFGSWVVWLFARHAVRTTKLFFALQNFSEAEFDRALMVYKQANERSSKNRSGRSRTLRP